MAQYKRILLKLSGESLMGGKQYGIDEVRLNEYAAQIKEIAEMGVQIGIVIGGFLAFALSITGGIFFVKLFNLFSKKKINPLIGATGLSAVPMASRVCNDIATKYDPKNHVLNYCMSSNISGVIGSAVAAGVLISFLG